MQNDNCMYDDEPEVPSGWMRLLIWPIDIVLFLLLLPIILVRTIASLIVALVYIIMARRQERAKGGQGQPVDQSRFRTLDTLLLCCGKLDGVRRSIGVFPRYGS